MFLKWLLFLITLFILALGPLSVAEEANPLVQVKYKLTQYHDSGKYYREISTILNEAFYYLQFRVIQNGRTSHPKKLAIVLNIDETALSNYPSLFALDFDVSKKNLIQQKPQEKGQAIPYVLTFYNYANGHDIAIFFVTSRPSSMKKITEVNLKQAGYKSWSGIYFIPENSILHSHTNYKSRARQDIINQGYDIVINIRDQRCDVMGGFADMSFKLPNPFYGEK